MKDLAYDFDNREIFFPFYRVEKTTSGAQKNGVGLAIAKESVDFHGGRVFAQNVDGVVGRGLEVRVYLPIAKDEVVRRCGV